MFWLHQLINHLLNLLTFRQTGGNYEGEDITYNTSGRKCQEVKEVLMNVVEKAFELVIPFFEEWKENNLWSTVEWHVDDDK